MGPVKKVGRHESVSKAGGKGSRNAGSGIGPEAGRKAASGSRRQSGAAKKRRNAAAKGTQHTVARESQSAAPSRKKRRGRIGRRKVVEIEKVIMRVRELDPRAKIGPATGVQRLFRVDAMSSGASETHLVFLDRHGLYCEHGRGCPAVAGVTKLDKSLKRTTRVG